MKAIRIHSYGDSSVLKYEDAPIPEIAPDEVLIKVHSAEVNQVDWKIRQGYLKSTALCELPLLFAWNVAGTIERLGALCS
jgi:NADPH:quinone reductase-like Zn-dependent oxidoreductase